MKTLLWLKLFCWPWANVKIITSLSNASVFVTFDVPWLPASFFPSQRQRESRFNLALNILEKDHCITTWNPFIYLILTV